jgi:putative DNA primase/helicase
VETTKNFNGTALVQTYSSSGASSTNQMPQTAGAPKHSEDALALKFAEKHGKELRYTAAHGRWNEWDGKKWRPDSTCRVFDRARIICRAEGKTCPTPGQARKVASAATVAAVERLARSDRRHAAEVDQWDSNPWKLNTPAGVLDLRTGGLRRARPEDYMTRITAVGPASGCPLWFKFLDRITNRNRGLQAFLQLMCGYALTGSTSEEVLFFLYGTGANGKSVFLNTIAGVMGDYARTAPIETFVDSQSERHPTELAGLQGARLVTATETEEGRRWAESKLKQMTGGDRIAARFMRQDFFEYMPQFKLMISGNHRPVLWTVDEAIRRRFILFPFTETIPVEERDRNLTEKLRFEWRGILGWAVMGCLEWQRNGLQVPPEVKTATEDYLSQEDALGRWLDERCERRADASELVSVLWTDWCQWTDANHEWTGKEKAFSQNLAARGFRPDRDMKGRFFHGLKLRPPAWAQAAGVRPWRI